MKNPSLKYSKLSETWQVVGLNQNRPVESPMTDDSHIYCRFEDNILRKFNVVGDEECVSFCDGKIDVLKNELFYVKNGYIEPLGIKTSGHFVISGKFVFVSSDFIDSQMIVKFDLNQKKEKKRSKLINRIDSIKLFQNNIVVSNKEELFFFNYDLDFVDSVQTGSVLDFDTTNNLIVTVCDDGKQTKIAAYSIEGKSLWVKELDGNLIKFITSDCFVFCSTEFFSYCLAIDGTIKWKKEPFDAIGSFDDETEHVIFGVDKTLNIYEVETGILVWQEDISHPVCGKMAIHKFGFAVSSYENGGLHYFGNRFPW